MMTMFITMMMMMIITSMKGDGVMVESHSLEKFKGKIRLPEFIVPKHYNIFLKPDLEAFKFTGTVEIVVDVVEDTRFLVLNVAELIVANHSISFQGYDSSQKLQPLEIITVEEDEILVLGFSNVLPRGEGVLRMGFDGILNDQYKGFFISEYEHNGEKKFMASTSFYPINARRCFPCWDEPALKATFKMTLEVPSEQVALSNMPIAKEVINGNVKKLFYKESPIMSTYSVAIVVGLFDYVEASTIDGINVRVYCQFGIASQGKFALDVAVKTLNFYKEYYTVPYPLPKLDMIATPNFMFKSFGLVALWDGYILYDESHQSNWNKQYVAYYIIDGLSNQWFGNLVTMEWWPYFWLNEGFASWLSDQARISLFPELKALIDFHGDITYGLSIDDFVESHPIEFDIKHVSEIEEYIDDINVGKGISLIQMLQRFVGSKCFQKSLASFMKRFSFSSAKSDDLWNIIEEESGVQVKMMMNSWTKQKGYPIVQVTLRDGIFKFEQSRFLANGSAGVGEWIIPITMGCGSYGTTKEFLLKTKFEQINASQLVDSSIYNYNGKKNHCLWTNFNVNRTGFYRVNYDGELEAGIIHAIANNKLSTIDKFGTLDDLRELCMTSKKNLSTLLSLMATHRDDPNDLIINTLINLSYKVNTAITNAWPELSGNVTKFLISLLQHSAERFGWDPKEGESPLNARLRESCLISLIDFGDSITRAEGLTHFNAFLKDRNASLLSADTRNVAYDAIMIASNKTNRYGFDSLIRIYEETYDTMILKKLASSLDPDIVQEALNFFLSSEVRIQDVYYGSLGLKTEVRETSWAWFNKNWEYISKAWDSSQVIYFAQNIINLFFSEEKAKEIEAFLRSKATPEIFAELKQSLANVKFNANWAKSIRNEDSLPDFLKELLQKI